MPSNPISPSLLHRVLDRLQIEPPREASPATLAEVYATWCQRVPFDNALKLRHVRGGDREALPGGHAEDFFESWLRYGTGGTCWSGAGALHAFLSQLGFDAVRGMGTMLVAPDLPPNHGTVVVRFGAEKYLVDSALLSGEPLKLDLADPRRIDHGAWGCSSSHEERGWHIHWRPIHQTDGLACRIDSLGASGTDYRAQYEGTRGWSPFNYSLYIRVNRGGEVRGIAFGEHVILHADGTASTSPITAEQRNQLLVEEFDFNEELVAQLPDDVPTPPPPGSQTAALLEAVTTE